MTEHVIETRGLRKQFGAKTAVEDLSLTVRRGEVFGFLGPNGAGKTTSVKMLLGLVAPTSGSASVLGAPLGDRRTRARLGFLPEHFRFQEWLTGRELLHLHARLLGLRASDGRTRAEALLARVDLLDAAQRPIRTYSKGMMQRVGLAQALLGQPELVFLDEPTSGLDPLGRLLVRDVIHELRERGTTVFLNSHLLGEVEATCSRVSFVKEGRTIHDMAMGEARGRILVELRTGGMASEARETAARFGRVLDGAAPDGEGPQAKLRVEVPGEERLPELARALVERGVPLVEMRVAHKSLESWFLEVMGEDQRPG
ncbi:MAG TPA: ABC transporter ATP-binding protein [Candidatus Eisenbacteria bacterium]|nr:ABC transporter ATP-binding protein [Candidatus Eisenbacteria bacterium]